MSDYTPPGQRDPQRRRLARTTATFGALSALVAALLTPVSSAAATEPVTYYVSADGNDAADGTSESTPLQTMGKVNSLTLSAGDRVLFRSGDSWTGKLQISGSGAPGAPISFGAYGEGDRPHLEGGGAQPATIVITTSSHIDITGLEISNNADTPALRSGIIVDNALTTPLTGIRLTDLSVHDVDAIPFRYGDSRWVPPGDGGIIVTGRADSATSMVNDLLIQDVEVDTVDDAGVRVSTRNKAARATGVHVNRVHVRNAGGNGIFVANAIEPVIEHSSVKDSGARSDACAGIWTAMSTRPLVQYNEVSGQTTRMSDGFAYDFDFENVDGVYQYNYSHDNPYGFFQFFFRSTGTIRYNVSQNDGNASFAFYNDVAGIDIYNNTVFITPGTHVKPVRRMGNAPRDVTFSNNLWVNWGDGSFDPVGTFQNNLVFGNHPGVDPVDSGLIVVDPLLAAPGSATSRTDAAGYALRPSSPALNAGVVVPGHPTEDFFGNPVTDAAPHIGAYNGAPLAATQQPLPALAVDDTRTGTGDRTWTYGGTWGSCDPCLGDSALLSTFEGSGHYSSTAGSTADFVFEGTRATLYTLQTPVSGLAAVSIDGGPETLVDLWGPSRVGTRPVFTSPELAPGRHTLRVRVTGDRGENSSGSVVHIDRIDVVRTPLVVDDAKAGTTSGTVEYSPGWWNSCNPCDGDLGAPPMHARTVHWSSTAGATATLRFTGTQASVRVLKGPNQGKFSVAVDGGAPVVVDDHASRRMGDLSVYTTPALPPGDHTLVVTVLGTKGAASSGTTINVDRFDVYD